MLFSFYLLKETKFIGKGSLSIQRKNITDGSQTAQHVLQYYIRPLTKVFYDLDTKVESATGRGIEGKTDVCI